MAHRNVGTTERQGVAVAPPDSITGVHSPSGVEDRVHWVKLTVRGDDGTDAVDKLAALLPHVQWKPLPYGTGWYSAGYVSPYGRMFTGGKGDAAGTALLDMSGSCCDTFGVELERVGSSWGAFIGSCLDAGCKFSRLDLARDEVGGGLSVPELHAAWKSGAASSRWRKCKRFDECDKGAGTDSSEGLAFGSRVSDTFMRIYDKRAEQAKGLHGPALADALAGPAWVRVELEYKSARAQAAAIRIAEFGLSAVLPGLLLGSIDFKVEPLPDGCKHPERIPTLPAWLSFLSCTVKLRLSVAKAPRTFDSANKWLHTSVAPTFAAVLAAQGADAPDFIFKLLQYGRSRWRPHHLDLVPEVAADARDGGQYGVRWLPAIGRSAYAASALAS